MRILILGGSGMLGHRLWINLSKEHETWVTIRGDNAEIFKPSDNFPPSEYIRQNVDALYYDQVVRAFAAIQPELVINCVGLIKQMGHVAKDPVFSLSLNAMLPHRISMLCRAANVRMIHISTDCVFSGKKGNYTEEDQSDAEDIYGRTKFLGEVHYKPHTITLRTSIIGRELKNKLGLIEWFLAQKGTIHGFRNAIYTGFTTDEISRIIMNTVIPRPDLTGVYHVSSDPISKYELLLLAKKYFKRDINILPDENFFCDRSLDSTRFREETGYRPPTWTNMIEEMAKNSTLYDERQ